MIYWTTTARVALLATAVLIVSCSEEPIGPLGPTLTDAGDDTARLDVTSEPDVGLDETEGAADACEGCGDDDGSGEPDSSPDAGDLPVSDTPGDPVVGDDDVRSDDSDRGDTESDALPDLDPDTIRTPDASDFGLTIRISSDDPMVPGEVVSGIITVHADIVGPSGTAGILGVEFFVNEFRVDTDLIPPYTTALRTTDWPDGNQQLRAFSAHIDGGTAAAESIIRFDNTPPEITVTIPEESTTIFYEDGDVPLRLDVDDPTAISYASIRANGLLVAEFFEPPFETELELSAVYVREDALPETLFMQYEAVDLLSQRSVTSYDVVVHPRFAWEYETLGEIWASPVVTPSGQVVFGNKNNLLTVVDPDGNEVNSWSVDGTLDVACAVDPSTGRIFAGTSGGTIYGFDVGSGSAAWSTSISSPPGGDLVFADGSVYVVSFQGVVYSLNPSSGSENWSTALPDRVLASPAVRDGVVYVGSQDSHFYSVTSGGATDLLTTGGEIWAAPAIDTEGNVYIGSNDGWLYAIDPDAALPEDVLIWSSEIEGQLWGRPIITAEGAMFLSSTSRFVHRIDIETGLTQWRIRTDGITRSSPTQGDDGTLYIGTSLGDVLAIEPLEGDIAWSYTIGDTIHGTPLVTSDRLYVGSTNRDFFALWLAPGLDP